MRRMRTGEPSGKAGLYNELTSRWRIDTEQEYWVLFVLCRYYSQRMPYACSRGKYRTE
jgi:hypothetical protein